MSTSSDKGAPEIILAQEQSVEFKRGFDNEIEGTLILTNKRLIFVAANSLENMMVSEIPLDVAGFGFADVDDLSKIPDNPSNFSIPLAEMDVEKGHEGIIRRPTLKVTWQEGGIERKAEFIEDITGGRKKDLKDWAKVIESLKSGALEIQYPKAEAPNRDSLEGRILYVLGDMQDKGIFEIEEQVENTFKVDLDPDVVEAACQALASHGFVDKVGSDAGDSFYRKRSPLGQDDLSS